MVGKTYRMTLDRFNTKKYQEINVSFGDWRLAMFEQTLKSKENGFFYENLQPKKNAYDSQD